MARRRRRKNKLLRKMNPPPGTMPLVVGTLALVAVGGGVYLYQKRPKGKKKKDCAPYKYSEAKVRASIEAEIDAGERDAAQVAINVATELFGKYPKGGNVTFPPDADAKAGVICVWQKTVLLVSIIFDERGIKDSEAGPIDFVIVDPYDEGYPWEVPAIPAENYPTPGMFADVSDSQSFNYSSGPVPMAKAALNSALAMAAARGVDVSTAQQWMAEGGNNARKLIKQMVRAIFCSPYNDSLYGRTVPAEFKNEAWNLFGWLPNKRSPAYLPLHYDNLARMAMGQKPKRGISLTAGQARDAEGNAKPGYYKKGSKLPGTGSKQPVFWITAVDLQKLGGPNPVVVPTVYSDGTSTQSPPPVVQRLGVDTSGISMPGGPGCS